MTEEEKKAKKREYDKEYRLINAEKIKKKKKEDYLKNAEKILVRTKVYYKENSEKIIKYQKNYRTKNKESVRIRKNIYQNKKLKTDHLFRAMKNMRNRIIQAIKIHGSIKSQKTLDLLGCDKETFKNHLESQFKEGMSWDNHAYKGWHIDHILPCDSFDLTDLEEQKKCFHYTNLQPLWWYENLSKGDRIISN